MLPQTRSSSFHWVKKFFRLDGMKLFKTTKLCGWAVLPQLRPSSFHGVEELFRLDVMQPFKTVQVYGWAVVPNIFCHGPAHFAALKSLSFYADCQQRSNQKRVVLPQTRSSSFHGVENYFRLDGIKLFKNTRFYGWAMLFQTRPNFFHGVEKSFRLMLCRLSRTFDWTVGRAPPNTGQLNSRGWSICSSGSYEAFQIPSNFRLGRSYLSTAQCFSTVLKILFVWIICSHLKPFKFMAGPRSPTSPVTTQLISRRWVTFSSWCYADCQQRSNQRLVVLPQTRSSSFHGVKAFSRLDVIRLFKYHQIYGWAVLPNIPCHGPAEFAALKNVFVVMLCRLSTTVKWTAGRASLNTVQFFSQC